MWQSVLDEIVKNRCVTRGLDTQVGFIRLAHLRMVEIGKPDFDWFHFFAEFLREADELPGQARQ